MCIDTIVFLFDEIQLETRFNWYCGELVENLSAPAGRFAVFHLFETSDPFATELQWFQTRFQATRLSSK